MPNITHFGCTFKNPFSFVVSKLSYRNTGTTVHLQGSFVAGSNSAALNIGQLPAGSRPSVTLDIPVYNSTDGAWTYIQISPDGTILLIDAVDGKTYFLTVPPFLAGN